MTAASEDPHNEGLFELETESPPVSVSSEPTFELESPSPAVEQDTATQNELFLPDPDIEVSNEQQIEFEGMPQPTFPVLLTDGRQSTFHHSSNLLQALEADNIDVQYQCREGYCGACRVKLVEGQVHYFEEPMAFIDDDEILPCCCVPKSPLTLDLE